MTHNTQKGLQPLKVLHEELRCDTCDAFPLFLDWLLQEKGFTSQQIIDVVAKPYHYKEEQEEYHETK